MPIMSHSPSPTCALSLYLQAADAAVNTSRVGSARPLSGKAPVVKQDRDAKSSDWDPPHTKEELDDVAAGPALDAAMLGLSSLCQNDLAELKAMQSPPASKSAVCSMLCAGSPIVGASAAQAAGLQ